MITTKYGDFELIENTKDTFDLEVFETKYIEEIYDKYPYILGDISGGILRLKGFIEDTNSPNCHTNIPTFLEDSCAFACGYYILKRNEKAVIKDE